MRPYPPRPSLPVAVALVVALVVAVGGTGGPAAAETGTTTTRLLGQLADESALVRERAFAALTEAEQLDTDSVGRALDDAPPTARPLLLQLAGARDMQELRPRVVELTLAADPLTAEAAVRALVLLGDEAVEAGRDRLRKESEKAPRLSAVLRRLFALHVQRTVEREVLSRWRHKGGSYDGRFADLRRFGWFAQPVLLAMLLDVPLEDHFVVLPEGLSPLRRFVAQREALAELSRSPRRGYATFEPLPWQVDDDEVFELAAQALMDVADVALMGDLLEGLAEELKQAHRDGGWQLRPFEDGAAMSIEEILAARGRPYLLTLRVRELEMEVAFSKRRIERVRPDARSSALQWYATDLSRLAGAQHRLREFDASAATYAECIEVRAELGGEAPAIASYNRACALARGGRKQEALEQLDASLGLDKSDLTREWVAEDGDLRSLHDDPAFAEMLDRHFPQADPQPDDAEPE